MKIRHTLPRHAAQLGVLQRTVEQSHMTSCKYICVAIDGPESIDRKASWASSFNDDDTHKIFQALADQTKK